MSRQIINDTYALQIPDSFEMISPEELQEMSRNGGDPFQWGVRDKDEKKPGAGREGICRPRIQVPGLSFLAGRGGKSGRLPIHLQRGEHFPGGQQHAGQEREDHLCLYLRRPRGKHGRGPGCVPRHHGKPGICVIPKFSKHQPEISGKAAERKPGLLRRINSIKKKPRPRAGKKGWKVWRRSVRNAEADW